MGNCIGNLSDDVVFLFYSQSSVSSSAQKKAEDEAKYAALRSEYEAKMDRIRAERRLEEKARVAAQNAEVRAKKDAAKAKSDAVSLFFVGIYTGN